jgi:hypothetical protein
MKKFLLVLGILTGAIVLIVLASILLQPWMDRWGATDAEIAMRLPGDELVATPPSVYNRAITIQATPGKIFPWLVQMGADRGGLYSYSWLEKLIFCPQINADRIHPEWQVLNVGDQVKMCPEGSGPLPFTVAAIQPDQALILGHQEADGRWTDSWQFVLLPAGQDQTRLVLRTRTTLVGGIWDVIHPGVFIMERAMLKGIQARAEGPVQP